MKNLAKRSLSLLLVLAMCISLLSGLTFTVSADNVTYRYSSEGYIYNWGERGTTATFLSQNAEAFYKKNGISYAELSQLSGSSSTSSVPSSALYQELKSLMSSAQTYTTTYNATRTMYQYTDCQLNGSWNSGKISSFYTGVGIGPAWDGGGTWNREHTWPDSKGDASGNGENDIMMLRPTSKSENSSRGNNAYGESSNYYDPNRESNGTYDLRGDVARIMLYVYTRWGNTGSMWGTSGVIESKEVLLKWMKADPVDTWELGRNDSVESITGTRNVYVDYPELAFLLFDAEIPAGYDSPSGESAGSAYTITATSSNTSHGTVSVSGKTVNASPKTGYYAAGYTVVSGSATVTQNGNAFTVEATSDCTVRINFAARAQVSVSFSENGTTTSQQTVYTGDKFNLPAASNVPAGFSFLGWVTGAVAETTQMPTYLAAGSEYTPTANTTLYALYSRTESGGTGTGVVYEKYTGALVEGDYIMTAQTTSNLGAMTAVLEDERLKYTEITLTNGTILSPNANIIWHIAPTDDGSYTIYNKSTESYAAGKGVDNKAALISNVTDFAKWTCVSGETYDFTNIGNKAAGKNASLRRNANYGFACYKDTFTQGLPITLYKGISSTAYYTTDTDPCDHSGEYEDVPAKAPTCTEPGNTAGKLCGECLEYFGGYSVIAATGHTWSGEWVEITPASCGKEGVEAQECENCTELQTQAIPADTHTYQTVVTAPTATQPGYNTDTCTKCGDSEIDVDSYTYMVSFSAAAPEEPIQSVICDKGDSVTLPTAAAPEGYTFAGWTDAAVTDTTSKPTVYKDSFSPTGCTTLYALYSYVEAGESTGSGDYVKVTEAPADWSGEYLIVYEAGNRIFDGSLIELDAVNNYQTVTITDNTIPAAQGDAYKFIIATMDGGYSIQGISGKYIGRTTSSNGLTTFDSASVHTISIDNSGNAVLASAANTPLRFNNASNQMRFRYYGSGQQPIALYKKDGAAGTTYYTTTVGEAVKISDASVTLDSVLGVNFKTNAPAGYTVQVTVGGESCEVTESNGVYSVSVFAQDMTKDIVATLYDKDSNQVDTETFRLAAYVADINNGSYTDEAKALAAATLAYCQSAAYVKYQTGTLPTLAAIDKNANLGTFPSAPIPVRIYTYLENACALRIRVGEGYEADVLSYDNIQPQDYDKVYSFVVTNTADGTATTVSCSVLAYLGACLQRSVGSDEMQNLLTAMYHYWAAAEAYVAADPAA